MMHKHTWEKAADYEVWQCSDQTCRKTTAYDPFKKSLLRKLFKILSHPHSSVE